jgi:hypothetical protein
VSGPLAAVLDEVGLGTGSIAQMSRHTGYPAEILRAAVDHLVLTGKLEAETVPFGCPPAGCSSCAASCGTGTGTAAGTGRTTLTLLRRTLR